MKPRPTYLIKAQHHAGIGLVEVLVALVIMSVGMLGIASLYVTSLQAKTTSYSRMKAINLAQDIADRIRANSAAVSDYALTESTRPSESNCSSSNCTGTEMAHFDLYEWDRLIRDTANGMGLPGQIKRSITVSSDTSTSTTTVTINLTWQEKNSGDLTYSLQIQI